MQGIVFDLILVAVTLLFAFLGSRRGLILSLCSLMAVVVALVGGNLVAVYLTPALTGQVAPMVEGFLAEQLASGALALSGQEDFLGRLTGELYASQDWSLSATAFVSALSYTLAESVLRPVLFLLGFVLVIVAWFLFSHALDLVAHLPVLHTLNAAGGFLFGAAEGAVLLWIASLILIHFFPAYFPQEAVASSRLLPLLDKIPPLF